MIQEFLAKHSYFRNVDPASLHRISQMAAHVQLHRGTILALEQEPCSAVYIVISGRLRAFKVSPQGREQVVGVLGSGEALYVVPALDRGALPATAQAITRASLVRFQCQDFVSIMESYPGVAMSVARELAQRLRQLTVLVEDLSLRSVSARLARLLLARARGPDSHLMTQREMAAQLGTVREVVARTLGQFEEQGWVRLQRGKIEIVDVDALEELWQR